MYIVTIDSTDYSSLLKLLSANNIISTALFLFLCFLGIAGRATIDIEIYKKKLKEINFFNRFILGSIFAYLLTAYIIQNSILKKYYSESIILLCVFSMDLINIIVDFIKFIIKYKIKVFGYVLNIFTKGMVDLRDTLEKDEEAERTKLKNKKQ